MVFSSHLLQMRGLKLLIVEELRLGFVSHLLQMRGLKQSRSFADKIAYQVASFTDAWIETAYIRARKDEILVASFTDAWIETRNLG